MGYLPDIVLKDRSDSTIAVVEVMAGSRIDQHDAAGFFETVSRQMTPSRSRFLLLVTPRFLGLWDSQIEPGSAAIALFRDYPAQQLAVPRYIRERLPSARMDGHAFELLVYQWLIKLREFGADADDEPERILEEIGFVSAIRDAKIELGRAA